MSEVNVKADDSPPELTENVINLEKPKSSNELLLEELDESFKHRFTDKDREYMQVFNRPLNNYPCVHPWPPRNRNQYVIALIFKFTLQSWCFDLELILDELNFTHYLFFFVRQNADTENGDTKIATITTTTIIIAATNNKDIETCRANRTNKRSIDRMDGRIDVIGTRARRYLIVQNRNTSGRRHSQEKEKTNRSGALGDEQSECVVVNKRLPHPSRPSHRAASPLSASLCRCSSSDDQVASPRATCLSLEQRVFAARACPFPPLLLLGLQNLLLLDFVRPFNHVRLVWSLSFVQFSACSFVQIGSKRHSKPTRSLLTVAIVTLTWQNLVFPHSDCFSNSTRSVQNSCSLYSRCTIKLEKNS